MKLSTLLHESSEVESIVTSRKFMRQITSVDCETSHRVVTDFEGTHFSYVSIFFRLFEDETQHRIFDCFMVAVVFHVRFVKVFIVVNVVSIDNCLIYDFSFFFYDLCDLKEEVERSFFS